MNKSLNNNCENYSVTTYIVVVSSQRSANELTDHGSTQHHPNYAARHPMSIEEQSVEFRKCVQTAEETQEQ